MSTQSRKYLITLNNPADKGYDTNKCLEKALSLKGLEYACVSMEIGAKEHTPHIHMFLYYKNPKAWQTIKHLIPEADIETCRGSCKENRDYTFKLGKWLTSQKGTTTIEGSQIEYGELPEERTCSKPELAFLYELIKDGMSNAEIISEYPEYMFDITHIDRCRLILKQEQYKNTWRNIDATFIYGKTGAGKSRFVMEKHGYENVFRVTDYLHPFDTYNGENIIVFEEFASSIKVNDMLNLLDGYPLKLPARYTDKIACYTVVYIISNMPLKEQYPNVQRENSEVWEAFLRRINKVIWYKTKDEIIKYNSVHDYLTTGQFHEPTEEDDKELPFD